MNSRNGNKVSTIKTIVLDLQSEQKIVEILDLAFKAWKNRKAYLYLLEEAVDIMRGFNSLARYTDVYNDINSLDKYHDIYPPNFEIGQSLTKDALYERLDYVLMTIMVIAHGNNCNFYRRRVMSVFAQMGVLTSMFGQMESLGYDSDKHLIFVEESANSPNCVNLIFKFPSEKEAA